MNLTIETQPKVHVHVYAKSCTYMYFLLCGIIIDQVCIMCVN